MDWFHCWIYANKLDFIYIYVAMNLYFTLNLPTHVVQSPPLWKERPSLSTQHSRIDISSLTRLPLQPSPVKHWTWAWTENRINHLHNDSPWSNIIFRTKLPRIASNCWTSQSFSHRGGSARDLGSRIYQCYTSMQWLSSWGRLINAKVVYGCCHSAGLTYTCSNNYSSPCTVWTLGLDGHS